jgi:hypothetical protein
METDFSEEEKDKIVLQIKPKLNADTAELDLIELKSQYLFCNLSSKSRRGLNFIDYYTLKERMETKGLKNVSFFEVYKNIDEYKKFPYILNAMDYYKIVESKKNEIQQIWRVYNLYYGCISVFKPITAMEIYNQFRPTSVLDFTMGWGGRLVGACCLNVPRYTGIDLNTHLKDGYDKMVQVLNKHSTTNIELHFENCLDFDYSNLEYDMVLTSPPYYNLEQYRGMKKMKPLEWNETFYRPIIKKTWEHLKSGGYYCLNVSTKIYKSVAKEVLGDAMHFIPLIISIRKNNYKEYIYVWKKE